jgi:hypothetical protein
LNSEYLTSQFCVQPVFKELRSQGTIGGKFSDCSGLEKPFWAQPTISPESISSVPERGAQPKKKSGTLRTTRRGGFEEASTACR